MKRISIFYFLLILNFESLDSVKFFNINGVAEIGKQWHYSLKSKADALNLKNITIYIRVMSLYVLF